MFGEVSSSSITVWEPGHRFATQEDKNPDGTFTAMEWLIESRDGGGAVVRFVHSGLLGEDWEAARGEAYALAERARFEGAWYRPDIGARIFSGDSTRPSPKTI